MNGKTALKDAILMVDAMIKLEFISTDGEFAPEVEDAILTLSETCIDMSEIISLNRLNKSLEDLKETLKGEES